MQNLAYLRINDIKIFSFVFLHWEPVLHKWIISTSDKSLSYEDLNQKDNYKYREMINHPMTRFEIQDINIFIYSKIYNPYI